MKSIKNLIALITGSSRGIGKSLALRLAREGVRVIVTGSQKDLLDRTVQEIRLEGGTVTGILCNLSSVEEVTRLARESIEAYGGMDILINNAGTSVNSPFEQTSVEDWDRIMAVNARAPFILCREGLSALKESYHATIINVGSVVGIKGYVNQSAYTASKHALMGFTKVLAQEVKSYNIRVYAINPGGVNTDMAQQMRPDLDTSGLIQPDEIADLVCYLLTHRNNAMMDDIHLRRANGEPWY